MSYYAERFGRGSRAIELLQLATFYDPLALGIWSDGAAGDWRMRLVLSQGNLMCTPRLSRIVTRGLWVCLFLKCIYIYIPRMLFLLPMILLLLMYDSRSFE